MTTSGLAPIRHGEILLMPCAEPDQSAILGKTAYHPFEQRLRAVLD